MASLTWITWSAGLLCLLSAVPLKAQHWSFQMYGTEQGLTNPTILAVHQDAEGFIWVSTEGGLFRYDGDRFRQFHANSVATRGNGNSLYTSADGRLWTNSNAGLFQWKGGGFAEVPALNDLDATSYEPLASDSANLYAATITGLRSMRLRGPPQPRLISPKPSHSVLVASDQTVWFSCGALLCSLRDGQEQEWSAVRGVTGGPWKSIAEDAGRRVWIRSSDQVLVREADGPSFHPVRNLPKLDSTHGSPLISTRDGHILIPHNAGLTICDDGRCRNYGRKAACAMPKYSRPWRIARARSGSVTADTGWRDG